MNVVQVDPFSDSRWLRFIENDADASIFYHPVWLDVLHQTYRYQPICLMAETTDQPLGVLPMMEVRSWLTGHRAVCLPFSDVCGVIARDDSVHRALLASADQLCDERSWRYLEIRSSVVPQGFRPGAHYKLNLIELRDDPDAMLRTFNQQTRRKLRKANAMNVRVERRTDDDALQAFVRLNALTRRRLGALPQPDSLFANIQRCLLRNGHGFFGVATLGREILAASVFLHWNGTVTYKYGASNDRARTIAASYAVMWDAIRWSCEHGFSRFDLGRSDLLDRGLLQFKRGWGSREFDLTYARRGAVSKRAPSAEPRQHDWLKPLISKMPVSLLKIIGARAYPHAG